MNHRATQQSCNRRRVLTLIGGGTLALATTGLAGCGGDEPAPKPALVPPEPDTAPTPPPKQSEVDEAGTATDSPPATAEAAPETSARQAPAQSEAAGGDLPRLDESSAQAAQLAYVHDASTLAAASQPRYESGQQCGNCALYQGGDAPWGGCPLFQGKRVKKTGWCNGYAAAG